MRKIMSHMGYYALAVLIVLQAFCALQPEAFAIETAWGEPVILDYYANNDYEAVLMSDGRVLAQGSNKELVEELNSWTQVAKLRCSYDRAAAVCYDSSVLCTGFERDAAEQMQSWTDIDDVFIGSSYILGLKLDGTVSYSCYYKENAMFFGLDETSEWENVMQLELADEAAVAVSDSGKVYTLGHGDISQKKDFDPEAIADGQTVWTSGWINFCLHKDGRISCWGIDENIYDAEALRQEKLIGIMPGDTGAVGIRQDGSLLWLSRMDEKDPRWDYKEKINACIDVSACSYNDDYENRGFYIVHKDGSVEVISESGKEDELTPVIESWTDVTQVYAGEFFACGLKQDGSIRVATLFEDSLVNRQEKMAATEYVDYYRSGDFVAALGADGNLTAKGANKAVLEELSQWENVEQISGFNLMLAGITYDGDVLSVGFPEEIEKQIDSWESIRQIFFWNDFAIGLDKNGNMHLAQTEEGSFFDYLDLKSVENWQNVSYMEGMVCPMQPSLVALSQEGRVYSLYADMGDQELNDSVNLTETIRDGVRISSTGYINHCVREDGSLVSWGPSACDLDPEKLERKDYVYALGYIGLKKDGSLCYLGQDRTGIEKDPLVRAISNCGDVKNLYSDGENYYALKNDGTVSILLMSAGFERTELEYASDVIGQWAYAESMEAGPGYVFMRDFSAKITAYPIGTEYLN